MEHSGSSVDAGSSSSVDAGAVLAAALKRSAVLWLLPAGAEVGGQPVRFHHDGSHVWVLTGRDEQPADALMAAATVTVVLRSHDSQAGRVVTATADVLALDPAGPATADAATATATAAALDALARTRLNGPLPDELVAAWTRGGVTLHRLTLSPAATYAEPIDDPQQVPTRAHLITAEHLGDRAAERLSG